MASTSVNVTDFKSLPGGISGDKKAYLFPQIDSVNSHGKVISWMIIVKVFTMTPTTKLPFVEEFLDFDPVYLENKPLPATTLAYVYVESKVADGKIKKITPTIVQSGLNKGKANETNVVCQALRDAYGKYNKQKRKAKSENQQMGSTERYPPMLAQVLSEQKNLDYSNMYVQTKYNGLRAVFTLDKVDNKEICIAYSRTKLLYPGFDYIKGELLEILKHYWNSGMQLYFDGELYKHGVNLQDISGIARRENKGDTKLNYLVYDCFVANKPEMTFSMRYKLLGEIFDNIETKYAVLAKTDFANSKEELDTLYKKYLADGYEGAMVRIDAPYKYSYNAYHSKVLLKMKPSFDAEYTVIGWGTGEKGKAAGALMIKCRTDNGKEFNVTPALGEDSMPVRMELAKKMTTVEENGKTYFENHYLGKKIIVEFDEKSKDDVPQRARTGLVVRDWD